jgi:hypothetical protein
MLKKSFSGLALAVAIVALFSSPLRAAVLYSNLAPNANLVGDYSIHGTNGAILDDVLIDNFVNNPTNQTAVQVSSVTVGILRDPGAAAATVTGYYGSTTTPANPNDFPILNNPQTQFGTVSIPAFAGASQTIELYTIVPTTPFTVALNLTDQPTFSEFAIGLRFSTPTGNGWAVAVPDSPDANLDGAWDANLINNTNAAYSLDFNGEPLYTTFMLEVNGVIVPEPMTAAGGALLLGALGLARLRGAGKSR